MLALKTCPSLMVVELIDALMDRVPRSRREFTWGSGGFVEPRAQPGNHSSEQNSHEGIRLVAAPFPVRSLTWRA